MPDVTGTDMDLKARTEIHEARTNIHLAESLLSQGKSSQARELLSDAVRHYRTARSTVTVAQSEPILDSMADVKEDLDHLLAALVKAKLAQPSNFCRGLPD